MVTTAATDIFVHLAPNATLRPWVHANLLAPGCTKAPQLSEDGLVFLLKEVLVM